MPAFGSGLGLGADGGSNQGTPALKALPGGVSRKQVVDTVERCAVPACSPFPPYTLLGHPLSTDLSWEKGSRREKSPAPHWPLLEGDWRGQGVRPALVILA